MINRFQKPEPRLELGQALRCIASATIDVSDGLMQDLGHIANASNILLEVNASKLPVSAEAKRVFLAEPNLESCALSGGDDYELAFTVPQSKLKKLKNVKTKLDVAITEIGWVCEGNGIVTIRDAFGCLVKPKYGGYQHF